MSDEIYHQLLERYQSGQVPWDQELPPPEVIDLARTLLPGRALDLGTGFGRAAIYLARLGWEVDAVDFIAEAIAGAVTRAQRMGVDGVRFHLSQVTAMPFLFAPYDLALDVGCMHNFSSVQLVAYCHELRRLLRPGAHYLLFAHLRAPDAAEARWLDEALLRRLFSDGFHLRRVEYGTTQVGDNPPWPSAWFWWQRAAEGESVTSSSDVPGADAAAR